MVEHDRGKTERRMTKAHRTSLQDRGPNGAAQALRRIFLQRQFCDLGVQGHHVDHRFRRGRLDMAFSALASSG